MHTYILRTRQGVGRHEKKRTPFQRLFRRTPSNSKIQQSDSLSFQYPITSVESIDGIIVVKVRRILMKLINMTRVMDMITIYTKQCEVDEIYTRVDNIEETGGRRQELTLPHKKRTYKLEILFSISDFVDVQMRTRQTPRERYT